MNILEFTDVEKAFEKIEMHSHITPILTSDSINEITGTNIYFKCENFQKGGAFKFRGACNSVLSLSDEEAKNGVAAHSFGNHAAALALAARIRGIKAYIVMPDNAPEIKKKAVAKYGGIITFCKSTLESREATLEKIVNETGATVIHHCKDKAVIAGQGSCALEFMGQVDNLDAIVAPVGGGSLLSGTAIAAKYINPNIEIIGAEPLSANDECGVTEEGRLIQSINYETIASGLLTSLSGINFEIIKNNVDAIIAASDDAIIEAMRMIWERMKIIVEPLAAVTLAIILENKDLFRDKNIGIIISGGNVDLDRLPWSK